MYNSVLNFKLLLHVASLNSLDKDQRKVSHFHILLPLDVIRWGVHVRVRVRVRVRLRVRRQFPLTSS